MDEEQNQLPQEGDIQPIVDLGSSLIRTDQGTIYVLTIVGQIEGHQLLPPTSKSTKYEHVLPLLATIEGSTEIDGLLILLNNGGGDVEALEYLYVEDEPGAKEAAELLCRQWEEVLGISVTPMGLTERALMSRLRSGDYTAAGLRLTAAVKTENFSSCRGLWRASNERIVSDEPEREP